MTTLVVLVAVLGTWLLDHHHIYAGGALLGFALVWTIMKIAIDLERYRRERP